MADEGLSGPDPLGDEVFDRSGPVLPAFGVVTDEILEAGAHPNQRWRKIEEFDEAPVPSHELEIPVEHGDALVDVIEAGLQQRALIESGGGLHRRPQAAKDGG